jgi:hypothetical protein
VVLQIADEAVDVVGGELQVGLPDELRPPKAVGAVGMTGLSLLGEEEHRLGIFVLHTGHRLLADARNVEFQLARRVRVEPHPDLVRRRLDFGVSCAGVQKARQPGDIRLGQHVRLREDQTIDGVLGNGRPVDELIHHVGVGAEGQHRRHRPDPEPLLIPHAASLQQVVEMLRGVGPEPPLRAFVQDH